MQRPSGWKGPLCSSVLWLEQKPEREAGPDQHDSESVGRAGVMFCESQASREGFQEGIDFT